MTSNRCVSAKAKANEKLAKYRYAKSPIGRIRSLYGSMKRRTQGKSTKSPHLYLGLAICSFEEFLNWMMDNKDFFSLYYIWKEKKFEHRLTPSVNRKDITKGYTLDNIEIIPFHENCRQSRGNPNRDKKGRYA